MFCFLFFDVAKVRIVAESAKNFKDNLSHSCLLLLAGTGAMVLRAGLVELPGKVEHKGATGRIVRCQLPVSVDDSIRLVSMEGIAATEVEGQRAHALQVEVALQSDVGEETGLGHAEIVSAASLIVFISFII